MQQLRRRCGGDEGGASNGTEGEEETDEEEEKEKDAHHSLEVAGRREVKRPASHGSVRLPDADQSLMRLFTKTRGADL